jgi:hypothetical protein
MRAEINAKMQELEDIYQKDLATCFQLYVALSQPVS